MENKQLLHEGFGVRLKIALEDARLLGSNEKGKRLFNKDAARVLGVSEHSVGKMLKGQRMPGEDVKLKICEVTGVCMEWLMMNRGPKRVEDTLDLAKLPEGARQLMRSMYEELESKQKGS